MNEQSNGTVFFRPDELETSIHIVHKAALMSARIQRDFIRPAAIKQDQSPVTVADFSVQAFVAHRLEQTFPADPLVGEEDAAFLGQQSEEMQALVAQYVAEFVPTADRETVGRWIERGNAVPGHRFWVIDPIDGTKGFVRGGQFVVALALVEAAKVKIGVLGCPNLHLPHFEQPGVIVYAAEGQGSWALPLDLSKEPVRLHVSDCEDMKAARMLFSYESTHTNEKETEQFMQNAGMEQLPVRVDSQAKQALLAAGMGEFLIRIPPSSNLGYKEKIWDQAAGAIVIEEAGGRVSDLEGKPLDFSTGRKLENNVGVFSSNGVLHERGLALFQAGR